MSEDREFENELETEEVVEQNEDRLGAEENWGEEIEEIEYEEVGFEYSDEELDEILYQEGDFGEEEYEEIDGLEGHGMDSNDEEEYLNDEEEFNKELNENEEEELREDDWGSEVDWNEEGQDMSELADELANDIEDEEIKEFAEELANEIEEEESSKVEDADEKVVKEADFLDENGNISVMDTNGDAFKMEYVAVDKIIVTSRIRKSPSTGSLEASIKSTGLLMPIVVAQTATDGMYVLISGYRRLIAFAKCGRKRIPCIVNTKVKTTDISILEALYNHYTPFRPKEIVDYINYLENEKSILDQSTIEYLLQLDNGDYPKLKDIMNDNDPDIVEDLMSGKLTIDQAYNKLKKKRQKQSKEEQEMQKVENVYGESKADLAELNDAGDMGSDVQLTDEEIAELGLTSDNIDKDVEDKSLEELRQEGDEIDGFEPERQKVGERHILDPAIRKAVMSRDNDTCRCCGEGGPAYIDVNDAHHVIPVHASGVDSVDNIICVCVKCHKMIHLQSRGQLHIPDDITDAEKEKFKKVVAYGNIIRKAMEKKGIKLEELKKKNLDNIDKIGRQLPGQKNTVD